MGKGKVLVTGGAGYIGSVAARMLAQQGYDVVIVDNLSTGSRAAAGSLPLEEVDVRDYEALERVFAANSFAAVVHFAAKLDVGESVREPLLYYESNVAGTLNVLRAMQAHGVKNIIFSSSASVYGIAGAAQAIKESAPVAPVSPYGRSKAAVEAILEDCSHAGLLRHVSLRYFNVAGGDLETPRGDGQQVRSNLIPQVIDAVRGKRPVHVFGADYPTPDGTGIRDYIHVADLAEAHVLALEYLERGGASATLNLGNGKGFSVREIIDLAGEVAGEQVEVVIDPRREGDPAVAVADATRAKEVLGWEPRRTDLRVILQSAFDAATRA